MIKSKSISWARHVASMGKKMNAYGTLSKGKGSRGRHGHELEGNIKRIFEGNEPSGSVKCREFLEWLSK
jgi:hypothetical protein